MNELKISSVVNAVNFQSSIGKSSSTSNLDFKSMLACEIDSKSTKTYTQEEIDNFITCKEGFRDNKWLTFPPENAPVEFKAIWNDVCSKMDAETFGLFTVDFMSILENGVSYPIEYPDSEVRYAAANERIERLGYAGCVEFVMQAQSKHVSHQSGNEQKFINKMQNTVDVLKEIMERLKGLDDSTINNQIMRADNEYSVLSSKDDRDGAILAAEMATGMSEEEFQSVLHRISQTQVKFMPDGTILTIESKDGHIVNQFRHKPHALNLL